jgi:quercetin dioxygenase-like cupin family protein
MARPKAFTANDPVAYLFDPASARTFDVIGPRIQFLTPLDVPDTSPCVIRGTVPPGVIVPLHSHDDPETFIMITGELEALVELAEGFRWIKVTHGGVLHVPGWAKHAWRNQSAASAEMFCVTTSKLGRFLREIGTPAPAGTPPTPPPAELMRHFHETTARYSYWFASGEENAAVGLSAPLAA